MDDLSTAARQVAGLLICLAVCSLKSQAALQWLYGGSCLLSIVTWEQGPESWTEVLCHLDWEQYVLLEARLSALHYSCCQE